MSRRGSSLFYAALVTSFLVSVIILWQIGPLDAAPSTPATTVVLNATQDAYTDMPAAGDPPDLVLTDLWKADDLIHFQIRNAGYGEAPFPVLAHLQIGGQPVADTSLKSIAAWTRVDSAFPTPFTCPGKSVLATVCAEVTGAVDPNPGDNCLSKELLCDTTPPAFVGAPTVKDIGAGQATVCWNTTEKTTGRVLFDRLSGLWGQSATDGISAAAHCVTLTKLEAAAGYHYLVEIEDALGNQARSKPGTFSTAALPDGQSPLLTAQIPKVISGTMTLLANASDNTAINRIRFLVDGKSAQTCYGPQCAFSLDSTLWTDGTHNITTQALDPAGNVTEIPAASQIRNSLDHNLSPVHVALLRPAEGAQVNGQVQTVVEVNHDLGLPLNRIEFLMNDSIVHTLTFPSCSRNGDETSCMGRPPLRVTFAFDVSSRPPGTPLILAVRAYDQQTPANWNETQRHVTVVAPPTIAVALSRRVTRVGSHFDVELSIRNTGGAAIRPVSFTDRSRGFQAAGYMQVAQEEPSPWSARVPCQVSDGQRLETSEIACQFTPSTLDPGGTRRVRYVLIPVIPNDAQAPISIGEQWQFSYEAAGRVYQVQRTDLGVEDSAARLAALHESDYVIATSAEAGFAYRGAAETNRLMAARAELAEARNGVFGDLSLYRIDDPERVKRAFSLWAPFLRPAWLASGYLLLTSGMPCKDLPTTYFLKDTQGWVRCSDNWYADTLGGDGLPNLRVGRLLGLYVDEETWIRNSLQVVRGERSFDRSQAMMVSGPEGSWEYFAQDTVWGADNLRHASPPTNNINFVHEEFYATPTSLLRDSLAILGTRWNCPGAARTPLPAQLSHLRHLTCQYDYDDKTTLPEPPSDLATLQNMISRPDAILVQNAYRPGLILPYQNFGTGADPTADWALAHDAAVSDVTRVLPGSDIYYWNGHGAPGAWAQFTRGSFGSTSGVVLSNSCLTGKWYLLGAQSAPESAAQAGAAVFVGSTEVSPVGPADWATIKLPTYTWLANRTVGEALVQAKWAIGTGSAPGFNPGHCPPLYDMVIHEFNLYGDPKFGAVATTESASSLISTEPAAATPAQPPETVPVTIPACEITQEAGIQRVTIPGGALTTEVGRPEVPTYVYRRAVPAGQRVQSVRIVSRSEPAALTDLIIPVFAANLLGRPAAQVDPEAPDEWYPADDLAWNQITNAEGGEELAVTLYPFRYNLARGEGQFYAGYTLEITYVSAAVSIIRLNTDAPQYRQGEPVNMTLKLETGAPTSGLMVGVAVENVTTGETIAGIPLRGLGELTGPATIDAIWQSASAAPGEYRLVATIEDAAGTALARDQVGFRLGYPQGEVTALTISPDRFMPGATVQLGMTVHNTGDQPLTGLAIIEIQDASGASIKRFEQLVLLKTGDEYLMQQDWSTAGLPVGSYRALGYLEYESRQAALKTAAFRAGLAVWLPLVLR